MPTAQFIHRGEKFQFVDGSRRYEGTCLWSWEEVAGGVPQRVSPIYIYAHSIRRAGLARAVPLGTVKKVAVARHAQVLLEARDPGLNIVVVEDLPQPQQRVR